MKRDIGVLHSIFCLLFQRNIAHTELVFALFPDEFGDGNGRIVEVGLGQHIHVVAHIGVDEVVGQHGIEQFSFDLYAIILHHFDVIFEVLPHLFNAFRFKEGT